MKNMKEKEMNDNWRVRETRNTTVVRETDEKRKEQASKEEKETAGVGLSGEVEYLNI